MDLHQLKSEEKEVCVCEKKRTESGKREREPTFKIMKKEEIHGFDHADEE